jgi:hypothetical protein
MIQKEGNYMFLHTYTFTIDIVPLVLEVHYFAGVILEYKGIIVKYTINQSAKQKKRRRPIQISNLGKPSTRRQPRPTQKLTRERQSRGGSTWVQPHPCLCQLGPASSGGIINALGGQFGRFPKLSPLNRP